MRYFAGVAVLVVLSAGSAFAGQDMRPVHKPDSAEFQRIKSWVGPWVGTAKDQGQAPAETVNVEYTLTSGGSVVVEKLFAGTPHEMVSTYYENGDGSVGMTHYCMLGNRPHLKLQRAEGSVFDFDWVEGGGVDKNEPHMHSLSVAVPDKDHLTQTWTFYQDGKPQGGTVITLHRP